MKREAASKHLVILQLRVRLIQKFAPLFSKGAKLNLLLLQLCVNKGIFLSSSKRKTVVIKKIFFHHSA